MKVNTPGNLSDDEYEKSLKSKRKRRNKKHDNPTKRLAKIVALTEKITAETEGIQNNYINSGEDANESEVDVGYANVICKSDDEDSDWDFMSTEDRYL